LLDVFSYKHEIFKHVKHSNHDQLRQRLPPNNYYACNKPKNLLRAFHAHAVIVCDHAAFAQMSGREQVSALFKQFGRNCDTAQQIAKKGSGAAAWKRVLAYLCAKLPDLTVQDEVTYFSCVCLVFILLHDRSRASAPAPPLPPPRFFLSCGAELRCGLTILAVY
jgi:hypothetical protein